MPSQTPKLPDTKFAAILANDPLPKMVQEALKLYGLREGPGLLNNPVIMGFVKEVGLTTKDYWADSVPWCALFMAAIAKRAGKSIPDKPLWALNWRTFGYKSPKPSLGDVLIFKRESGGHVGLYIAESASCYYVLGGNQGDMVSIVPIAKYRMVDCRRPEYRVQPECVRPYVISGANDKISTNEA